MKFSVFLGKSAQTPLRPSSGSHDSKKKALDTIPHRSALQPVRSSRDPSRRSHPTASTVSARLRSVSWMGRSMSVADSRRERIHHLEPVSIIERLPKFSSHDTMWGCESWRKWGYGTHISRVYRGPADMDSINTRRSRGRIYRVRDLRIAGRPDPINVQFPNVEELQEMNDLRGGGKIKLQAT